MTTTTKTQSEYLFHVKLSAPQLPPSYICRSRLYDRFVETLSWKIVLVSSPIGYGKTVLLSEWYHQLKASDAYQVSWFSAEKEDNEATHLFPKILIMLARLCPEDRQEEILAQVPNATEESFRWVSTLLHEIFSDQTHLCVLFMDGIDRLNSRTLSSLLKLSVEYLPANFRLVLAGSVYPPDFVNYSLWNDVYEFTHADISFDQAETRTLLSSLYGVTSDDFMDKIWKLTHGWAAGIRLFGDSLVKERDTEASLTTHETFAPFLDRYLSSYFHDQISEETLAFMLKTSILEEFSAELCDYLLGASNSQEIINQLLSINCFIEICDRDGIWYRYNPAITYWLQEKLHKQYPNEIESLSYLAHEWLENNNHREMAVKYMLMAGDADLLETLILSAGLSERTTKKSFTLWLCRIPSHELSDDTTLILLAIWGFVCDGRPQEVREWLELLKNHLASTHTSDLAVPEVEHNNALTVMIENLEVHYQQMMGYYDEAIAGFKNLLDSYEESMSIGLRCTIMHALGESHEYNGDLVTAKQCYHEAESMALLAGSTFFVAFCRFSAASVKIELGEYQSAKETCLLGINECPRAYNLYHALHYLLALVQTEQYDLDEASKNLEIGMNQLSQFRNCDMWYEARLVKAVYLQTEQRFKEAEVLISQSVLLTGDCYLPRCVNLQAHYLKAVDAVRQGDISEARVQYQKLIQKTAPANLNFVIKASLIKAHIIHHEQGIEPAIAYTKNIIEQAKATRSSALEIDTRLLASLLLYDNGQVKAAAQELYKALLCAHPIGAIGVFVRNSTNVLPVLRETVRLHKMDKYIGLFTKETLQIIDDLQGNNLSLKKQFLSRYHITEREWEIIELLNIGYSRQEVSDKLFISFNTVKTHLATIYTKLGVKTKEEIFEITAHFEQSGSR